MKSAWCGASCDVVYWVRVRERKENFGSELGWSESRVLER